MRAHDPTRQMCAWPSPQAPGWGGGSGWVWGGRLVGLGGDWLGCGCAAVVRGTVEPSQVKSSQFKSCGTGHWPECIDADLDHPRPKRIER
jgi:hypothetical protein